MTLKLIKNNRKIFKILNRNEISALNWLFLPTALSENNELNVLIPFQLVLNNFKYFSIIFN